VDGVSVSDGDSSGVGVGDAFLRFDLLRGVGDGVGDAFLGLGEAVGDGVDVGFFVECFRCLRDGVGVESGSRTFLILVPNDSSAEGAALAAPNKIARIRNHFILHTLVSAVLSGDSNRALRSDALRQRTYSRLGIRELFQDGFVEANSTFEIFERKVFVR
jgi:hypothetical protein